MDALKTNLDYVKGYIFSFVKWCILAVVTGVAGGILGSSFHLCIDYVTELRSENPWMILFLPIGGLFIALLYKTFSRKGVLDTNRVIESVREGENIPLIMVPLIYVSSVITHALGGSAGREGAALQLGGSIGYNIGKLLRFEKNNARIMVMSGMSAVFAALFGTPLTAAIFSLEVTNVGTLHYMGLLPCLISSIVAAEVAKLFGLHGVRFDNVVFPSISYVIMIKVAILAVLCALASILFCFAIKKSEKIFDKTLKNCYLRSFVGGGIIVALTYMIGSYDYNGAGMDVITAAIGGDAVWYAFLVKIVFTAITISAGFKGGEIVPSFFIGATLGCAIASILGIDASFAAAIGFIAFFCGVVNCPIASVILAIEVFGTDGLLMFALACSISYMMSGSFGIYHSQKILYSKIDNEYMDRYTV